MVSVALPKTNSSSVWCKLPQGSSYDSTGGAEGSLRSVWPLTPACLPKVKITHSRGARFFFHLLLMKEINYRHRHVCAASNTVLCGFSLHFLPVHSFHVLSSQQYVSKLPLQNHITSALWGLTASLSRINHYQLTCLYLPNGPHKACFTQLTMFLPSKTDQKNMANTLIFQGWAVFVSLTCSSKAQQRDTILD